MKLHNRVPDIENIYKVLRCERPERPTLFEFFMNGPLYERLAQRKADWNDARIRLEVTIDAYAAAGYDYATAYASSFGFPTAGRASGSTISLNEGFVITDEASFEEYKWPEPESFDYSHLEKISDYLPGNMKLMVMGPGGVLENTIALVGYENLCVMVYENPELARAVFDSVGSRLVKHYEIALEFDSVGFISSNDDWGFNTQTFFSPPVMREYVFPWHRKIVDAAHKRGKPVILHSCGYFNDVMEDTIEMGFDGKHSYEDVILPVEDSYERWKKRIAILGGIDVDFVIRSTPEQITARSRAMLDRSAADGGYALGTGNSVPEYVPQENFLALVKAALEY